MIAIIDYGAGNIKSLQFALDKLGIDSRLTTDKEEIANSKAIILPGVGAFKDAMDELENLDLIDILQKEAIGGKTMLGICLGMQLFYETSYENGEWNGLGLLKGRIDRLRETVKVPHMGWNTLDHQQEKAILKGIPSGASVYFVHSYYAADIHKNELVSSCNYGVEIPAIVQKKNIIGMQFHPEKSGKTGLQLLQNFGELIL